MTSRPNSNFFEELTKCRKALSPNDKGTYFGFLDTGSRSVILPSKDETGEKIDVSVESKEYFKKRWLTELVTKNLLATVTLTPAN